MTSDEWFEIVEWVNDRLPGWTVDRAAAYGLDLKDYGASDVWDALYRLYDRGLEYAPNGSQLKAETVEVIRDRMEAAKRDAQGLPETTEEDMTWEAWRDRLGYEGLSVNEAADVRHAELFVKGCHFWGCDVCGNVDALSTTV